MKTYFVARIKPWTGGAGYVPEYVQAVSVLDALSCDAMSPVLKITAQNKKEAVRKFHEHQNRN